jgi:ADP-ribose pyrophosphatase
MATVFTGRVFSVEVERKTFPNGSAHTVEIVRHRPSVVLIPIRDDGRIVLIRQFRPSINRDLWELPAGSVEPGETVEEAAIRECEEEIGVLPRVVERLTGIFLAPGFCDEELIYFRLSDFLTPGPAARRAPDEDEDIHAEPFTVEEAKGMLADGTIVDLKTAFGLTLL